MPDFKLSFSSTYIGKNHEIFAQFAGSPFMKKNPIPALILLASILSFSTAQAAATCQRAEKIKLRGILVTCVLHYSDGSKQTMNLSPSQESECVCDPVASLPQENPGALPASVESSFPERDSEEI